VETFREGTVDDVMALAEVQERARRIAEERESFLEAMGAHGPLVAPANRSVRIRFP